MFAGPLAEVLGNGKYTEWVLRRDFTEDHLLCLLCMVGEFDTHAPEVMRLLWQNASRLKGETRSVLALEALHCIVRGERFDRYEWSRRMTSGGPIRREVGDLPEPVRARLGAASPGTRWKFVLMTPEGYELGGEETSGRFIEPAVSRSGEVVFKLNVPWDAVPATVAGAVKARFPDFQMPWAYARLAADGTIAAYEIVHVPRTGTARRTQRIAIGPDGTEIPVSTD